MQNKKIKLDYMTHSPSFQSYCDRFENFCRNGTNTDSSHQIATYQPINIFRGPIEFHFLTCYFRVSNIVCWCILFTSYFFANISESKTVFINSQCCFNFKKYLKVDCTQVENYTRYCS